MPTVIKMTYDCEKCGGEASTSTLDFTQDNPEVITLDIEMVCSQQRLDCEDCGTSYYTGDLDILNEDEL
jgi:transcription elongation factor Elf1